MSVTRSHVFFTSTQISNMTWYPIRINLLHTVRVPPTPEDTFYYKHMSVYCSYSFTRDKALKEGVMIGYLKEPRVSHKGEIKLLTSGDGSVIPAKIDSDIYVPVLD